MEEIENISKKRLDRAYRIITWLIRPIIKLLFHFQGEKLPKIEGPYLLLCNHNNDADPGFLATVTNEQCFFVATENITRMGLIGRLAVKYFNPILHSKGVQGAKTVKSILRHIKEGHNVALFPEGNKSFNGVTCPIGSATGKLARTCGATLITYRLTGDYFTTPRWGKGIRKGKIKGTVAGVYSPEKLRAMTVDEVNEAISNDLFVDAYEDQKKERIAYKGKRMAEGLESTLFMCPRCGSIGTLHSNNNMLICTCGFKATYDEYGYLKDNGGNYLTITELDKRQREQLIIQINSDTTKKLFEDQVELLKVNTNHEIIEQRNVKLSADKEKLYIEDIELPFSEIEGVAITQRNLLTIHLTGSEYHYEFKGPMSFSALKYLYVFQQVKGSQFGLL